LSNTMSTDWCKQTLQGAIARHGCPEILNTDQGSQFTAYEFCDWVTHPERGIKLSMDGKGRAIDNIFIERLWRSVKYEHVYLFPAGAYSRDVDQWCRMLTTPLTGSFLRRRRAGLGLA